MWNLEQVLVWKVGAKKEDPGRCVDFMFAFNMVT
jgi:hypothetical protein